VSFGNVDVSDGARIIVRAKGFIQGTGKTFPFIGPPAVVVQYFANGKWNEAGRLKPRFDWSECAFNLTGLIPDIYGDVKIRIYSISHGAKYNEIDYVALSTGTEPDKIINTLTLSSAILNSESVLSDLSSSDNSYVNLQPNDLINIEFNSNSLEGDVRDFIFVSEGYYQPSQQSNTYYFYTWDGTNWVERSSHYYTTSDESFSVNLSSYLPDANGEYKVRVYHDYDWVWSYFDSGIDYVTMTEDGVTASLLTATDLRDNTSVYNQVISSDNSYLSYYWGGDQRWSEYSFENLGTGNISTCSMTVTVLDAEPPYITCPENISVSNDLGKCSAYVTVPLPETSDNCFVNGVVNDFNNTGIANGAYPIGTTTVNWTVTDQPSSEKPVDILFKMEAYEDQNASCPWIFAWNGQSFVKDNDIYSVARYQQSEYTDYYALNKTLISSDGKYKLQIQEIQNEESFTDFIGLKAVDHASDVAIAPDDIGNIYAYKPSNLILPVTVISNKGLNVTSTINSKNNIGFSAYSNNYLDVNFGRVDVSDGARIILKAKGFIKGIGAPSPFIGPPAVIVKYLDNGNWVEAGRLKPRFDWSECIFDLSGHLPDNQGDVKIRVISISHDTKYNEIDFIALASGTEPEKTVSNLTLSNAVLNNTSVLNQLNSSDNGYVNLKPNEIIDIEFSANDEGTQVRDFIFTSKGYYQPTQQTNTFYFYTWDGTNWVQRGSRSYLSFDELKAVDLSAYLPDPNGEYKVRVYHDVTGYEWNFNAGIDYVKMTGNSVNAPLLTAKDLRDNNSILSLVQNSDDYYLAYWGLGTDRWSEYSFEMPDVGNSASCSMTVQVTDAEPPSITCPQDITVENDLGECSAYIQVPIPNTGDNCGVESLVNDFNNTGNATGTYPVGTTTVKWTVTDIYDNETSCSMKITVIDAESPIIICSADITQATDPGSCSATIEIEKPFASDNCLPIVTAVNYSLDNNLVTNGDFTSGVSNWQNCSNTAEVNTEEYYIVPLPPPSTNKVAEIDVDKSLCQNITGFTVGKEYLLTFKATRRQNDDTPYPVSAVVTIDDGVLSKIVTRINTTFNLTPVAYKFTATQTTHQLKFTPYTDNYSSLGFIVDDIAIYSLNVPSDNASGIYPFGVTEIKWTVADLYGNASSCTQTVNVNEVTTITKVEVDPTSQQYSDKVTFKATVTPYECDLAGTSAESVTFYVDDQVMGDPVPLVNGIATATYPMLEPTPDADYGEGTMEPGPKTVTAVFNNVNDDFILEDPTTPLTITCEDVAVTNTGDEYFTASPNTNIGTVLLSAYALDDADGNRGDIRNANITFYDGLSGPSLAGPVNVGLVTANTWEGVATATFDYELQGSELNGGAIWNVYTKANNYYCGVDPIIKPITLAMPGNDYVTGGGHIVMSNTSGQYLGINDGTKKMNFGLVMKWNKSGKNLQGKVNVIYRGMYNNQLVNFQIKSNAISSLSVKEQDNYKKATITTKANFRALLPNGTTVDLGGNLSLRVTAWESTNGNDDMISVQLSASEGSGLYFSSYWLNNKTVEQELNGGKIQVGTGKQFKEGDFEGGEEAIAGAGLNVYPNPFHTNATVQFSVAESENVSIVITNSLGIVVRELLSRDISAGDYTINWDGLGTNSQLLSSGVYYITLTTASFMKTVPVTLIK
jgi:hypothetical protein